MKKTNILFCILYLAHGGTEKQLITLINGLDRSKFTPHLCCINKSNIESSFLEDALSLFKEIKCGKIHLDFKSFKNLSSILYILELSRYIRRNKIDIVVSYFIDPTIMSFVASKLSFRKTRQVVSFRDMGLLRNSQHKVLMKWIYHRTPFLLANSEAVKQDYVENDNIPADKITVIYNGIDIEKFMKIQRTQKRPDVIGIIANLNRRVKRVDVFLRAAACIYEKRKETSFIIIGEGKLKTELKILASKLGINNKVNFVGRSYDVDKDLKKIHIGVNTSETEGFSNVILEYLASGIPVVATNTGGNREIIVENKNGFLFTVNDYKELAEKTLLILDDETLYAKLSSNSRKSVSDRFENSIMVNNYELYFHKIIGKL